MCSPGSLTVISLGGGVQSPVIALMANESAFDRVPNRTIADTKREPPSIHTKLEWLTGQFGSPLRGGQGTWHTGGRQGPRQPQLHGHPRLPEGQWRTGRRQCADNYNISPVRHKILALLGLGSRQRVPAGTVVELWLGISTNEAIRMKPSRDRWIRNRCPLIGARLFKRDCLDWWAARYDRPLERSARVACTFQSRHNWVETMRRGPGPSSGALEIDSHLQGGLALDKPPTRVLQRCPSLRRSCLTRRSSEAMGKGTGPATSARRIAVSDRPGHWRNGPLTAARQRNTIQGISWPAGPVNTPDRGATCRDR